MKIEELSIEERMKNLERIHEHFQNLDRFQDMTWRFENGKNHGSFCDPNRTYPYECDCERAKRIERLGQITNEARSLLDEQASPPKGYWRERNVGNWLVDAFSEANL